MTEYVVELWERSHNDWRWGCLVHDGLIQRMAYCRTRQEAWATAFRNLAWMQANHAMESPSAGYDVPAADVAKAASTLSQVIEKARDYLSKAEPVDPDEYRKILAIIDNEKWWAIDKKHLGGVKPPDV